MTENISSGNNQAIIRALEKLQSKQAVVVVWEKGWQADLRLYECINGHWELIGRMPANLGKNGIGKTKEGDQKSPAGIFTLGTAFGNAKPPEGLKYPYRLLTEDDYWVDDSRSRFYNQWVRLEPGRVKEWDSAEWLRQETICYKYAIVVNYNVDRNPEKGSAIFLHVWRDKNTPTQGCTAVSEPGMIRILQWLNPVKKPLFIQGSYGNMGSIMHENH